MERPFRLIGFGSGLEGWLSIELDGLRFTLELEDGKPGVEVLSLSELKCRLPNALGWVADAVANAILSQSHDGR